jgi:hypothetical protein
MFDIIQEDFIPVYVCGTAGSLPLNSPSNIVFHDDDADLQEIAGHLTFGRATAAWDVTHYRLYYGGFNWNLLDPTYKVAWNISASEATTEPSQIASSLPYLHPDYIPSKHNGFVRYAMIHEFWESDLVVFNGSQVLKYTDTGNYFFNDSTAIGNATHMLLYACNADGEIEMPIGIEIIDKVGVLIDWAFIGAAFGGLIGVIVIGGVQRLTSHRAIEKSRFERDAKMFSDKYIPVVLTREQEEEQQFQLRQLVKEEEMKLEREKRIKGAAYLSGKPVFARNCVVYGEGIRTATCGMEAVFYVRMKDLDGFDVACTQEDIELGLHVTIHPPEDPGSLASFSVEQHDPELVILPSHIIAESRSQLKKNAKKPGIKGALVRYNVFLDGIYKIDIKFDGASVAMGTYYVTVLKSQRMNRRQAIGSKKEVDTRSRSVLHFKQRSSSMDSAGDGDDGDSDSDDDDESLRKRRRAKSRAHKNKRKTIRRVD